MNLVFKTSTSFIHREKELLLKYNCFATINFFKTKNSLIRINVRNYVIDLFETF